MPDPKGRRPLYVLFTLKERKNVEEEAERRFMAESNFIRWMTTSFFDGTLVESRELPVATDFEGPSKPKVNEDTKETNGHRKTA